MAEFARDTAAPGHSGEVDSVARQGPIRRAPAPVESLTASPGEVADAGPIAERVVSALSRRAAGSVPALMVAPVTKIRRSGASVIHRKYLDGQAEWVGDTTFAVGKKGKVAARSKELQSIDALMAGFLEAKKQWDIDLMINVLGDLLKAIQLREESKGTFSTGMRQSEIDQLKKEATDWRKAFLGWRTAFNEKINKHKQDRATLNSWVDEGLNQTADIRLRNACQWVRSGKMKFYLCSETHDSRQRAAKLLNKDEGVLHKDAGTYFPSPRLGPGDLLSPIALYNWKSTADATNVQADEDAKGTKGWNQTGKYIVVTEEGVAGGKAAVFETLKHEVQHDADKNKGDELNQGVTDATNAKQVAEQRRAELSKAKVAAAKKAKKKPGQKNQQEALEAENEFNNFVASAEYTERKSRIEMQIALRRYKTEYRAHWYQGNATFDSKSATTLVNKDGFQWNERQWTIFEKIKRNYAYVANGWGTNPPTPVQVAFRSAVVAYTNPDTEGFNKLDSIRIDDFYNALHDCPKNSADPTNDKVKAVLKALDALDEHDIDYLTTPTESRMLNRKVRAVLTGAALAKFNSELEESATGHALAGLFQ